MSISSKSFGAGLRSVSLYQTSMGLTASERLERFKLEAASELVLRLVGGLLVAGSTLLWLVLPMGLAGDQLVAHAMLAAIFTAVGLGVYAYGTRGFRRQLSFDGKRRVLSLTKVNVNDQVRVARKIDVDEIESVFVRRSAKRNGFASLVVRVAGKQAPVLALTGEKVELEQIHRILCDLVQTRDNGLDLNYRRAAREARSLAAVRI
ncbi:MAG: hypothetical protein AAFY35_09380 [Pseudomonadota bacterium]